MSNATVPSQRPERSLSTFKQFANQCRAMAAKATSDDHKKMLLDMAAVWDGVEKDGHATFLIERSA